MTMSNNEKCDISKDIHISENVLGECSDCGGKVCANCGFSENGIIKHNSEEYCFSDINIMTEKVYYHVIKRKPKNKITEKISNFKDFLNKKIDN
jgi:hypothetical protein